MCGICGVIGKKIDELTKHTVLDSIKHRGPDDEGVYCDENIFLGHRRLAILDLSNDGHQPMFFQEYAIVYNGEIYNYLELRHELSSLGHKFVTKTDTEVFLHAFAEWGNECFEKFRGMWAACIYDKNKNKIILSRDRFGIKPLYYYFSNNVLYFASEIPALLKFGIPVKANTDRIVAYLMVDISENKNDTFFEGIMQLPGGSVIEYSIESHYFVINSFYNLDDKDFIARDRSFETEYVNSINMHLRSDVQVGACLSGGLDSSTLVAVAQRELDKNSNAKMVAVTAKSEELIYDETKYAKYVVDYSGLNWKISYPRYNDFVKDHKKMLLLQAEPVGSPSVFMQYWVMKTAKEAGIKVILDGQGGDETLLGYERYYINYLIALLKKGDFFCFLKDYNLIVQSSKMSYTMLLKYFIYFGCWNIRKRYLSNRMRYVKKELQKKFFAKYKEVLTHGFDLKKMQIMDIIGGHLSALLRYEDRNSMGASIESRVPYIDHILLEHSLSLAVREKINDGWTKYILRKVAQKYLPEEVVWRKHKLGFDAPESIWLERYIVEMQTQVNNSIILKEVLEEIPNLEGLPLRERWRLYNIAVWEEQYL